MSRGAGAAASVPHANPLRGDHRRETGPSDVAPRLASHPCDNGDVNLQPVWKRVLAFVGLLGFSVWMLAMGLQTVRVSCERGQCVRSVEYAGITTSETAFAPSAQTVTWKRTGKYNNQGLVIIEPLSGGKVNVDWLSPSEAEAAVHGMIHDPGFQLESTGPRWWLLFLFATIPLMFSTIFVPKFRPGMLPRAPPVEQTKKAARAARGKAKKARERV